MKTLKKAFLLATVICLAAACSKSDEPTDNSSYVLKSRNKIQHNHSYGLDQERYVTMSSIDLKVHYRIIGKGPIDVVFIPGWTNPLEVYTMQFDYFRDKARCIYIDLPGHGLSDAPEGVDYTMDLMADAIYDVLKKEGVHRFVGVGFSMGPVVLGQFFKKYPDMVTKVVNLDGGFSPWPTEEPDRQYFIDGLTGFFQYIETWEVEDKQDFASTLLSDGTPDELKELVEYFYVFPSWLMANIFWNFSQEEPNIPPAWEMPFLCLFTQEVNEEYIQAAFPGADIYIFEGSGHVLQWERHEQINPLLWSFISEGWPGNKY